MKKKQLLLFKQEHVAIDFIIIWYAFSLILYIPRDRMAMDLGPLSPEEVQSLRNCFKQRCQSYKSFLTRRLCLIAGCLKKTPTLMASLKNADPKWGRSPYSLTYSEKETHARYISGLNMAYRSNPDPVQKRWQDPDPLHLCIRSKCEGQSPGDFYSCMYSRCVGSTRAARTAGGRWCAVPHGLLQKTFLAENVCETYFQ